MKILLISGLILIYLLIGYVLTAVMIALDFSDWADEPDMMLLAGTLMWPFFNIPSIVISIVAKIVTWLGNKIAVYLVSIALIIKAIIERRRKEKLNEDHHSTGTL